MSYLAKRLAIAAAHLAALSLLSFGLANMAPGDVLSEARFDPQVRGSLDAASQQLGLHRPWPERYVRWLGGALTGDLGRSLSYGIPVATLLKPTIPRTLAVAIPAWQLSWLAGLFAAWLSVRAARVRPWMEGAAAALQMVPEVILASLLAWPLVLYFRIDPRSIWMPLVPVTLGLAPAVFLHASAAFYSASSQRFVSLARVAAVPGKIVRWRYIAPAAANPLLSLAGPTLVAAFGMSLAVEAITGWPGAGFLFLESFTSRDYPVTQAMILLLGAVLTLTNLISDLVLFRLDPRIGAS